MKVLIVGQGGREHALAWHAAQHADQVFVAPGNDGMRGHPKITVTDLASDHTSALIALAQKEKIDLTLIGPEAPLVAGVVDRFQEAGLTCFGPSQAASRLEGSKAFMKELLVRHGIPTARASTHTDLTDAEKALVQYNLPVVVKADGLASGKGVVIAHTSDAAHEALRYCFTDLQATMVLLEECLEGEEVSFMVLTDGTHALPLASVQDHKTLHEGDTGPNTGGMGAYSPAPVLTQALQQTVMDTIIHPTLQAMRDAGTPFVGFLYAGLMVDPQGQPWVLEYNVRLGDPETQVLVMRLQSSLLDACWAALNGTLATHALQWSSQATLGIVLAAPGYPEAPEPGHVIQGLPATHPSAVQVFHAGTRLREAGVFEIQGGRVVCVAALGDTLEEAKAQAEQAIGNIAFQGMQWRRDIGHRALKRTPSAPLPQERST